MNDNAPDSMTGEFWRHHPDPTQAAVHLTLQWLAFVYPASALQIDRTLKEALPYADADLSSRWSRFLEENDVEDHVAALEWVADTLSPEQIPFLVETAWRLLLVDYELPRQVPLALRILARVLSVEEDAVQRIGESVFRELTEDDAERKRAPLLPVDPRYLDRVEWRLYGNAATTRMKVPVVPKKPPRFKGLQPFLYGVIVGGMVVGALVFGPLQLGRVKVPIMLHDGLLIEGSEEAPEIVITNPDLPDSIIRVPQELQADSEPSQPAADSPVAVEPVATSSSDTEVVPAAPSDPPEAVAEEETVQTPVEPERQLMTVTASILNVRDEADVNSEVVLQLAEGDEVWAYPAQSEGLWMQIRVDGLTGYASARFLQIVN